MKKFLTLFFFCHVTCAVKHSLKFYLTGTSGETNFPEFVGAAAVDGVKIGHCDSIIRRVESKHNWIRRLIEGNPEHLQWYSQKCLVYHQRFKSYIEDFKQHLNQTKVSPSEFPVPSAVGGAAGMVLLLVFSGVLYYCWRKRNDFQSVHGDLGKEEET
ncbi:hypothetical protein FQA47_003084 [Oryzias melastigma]|uniref:MHC class I-like antigen recognition-like domain-containing protein n=1 Tax=Oryzias melastigma TaxID=30732 RepID=A0A834EZ47_ORYME|nr:hypothetical protein FQA47_003084 [Oryzias melastigma]